jgi:Tol biopolymer transport system component
LTLVVVVAACLCTPAPAGADHTLDELVSPPGNANYDWNRTFSTPESVNSTAHMSPDGSRVILATTQPFDPADTDTEVDLYEAAGGSFQLVTPGTTSPFGRVDFSLDGSVVAFETSEALLPQDNDFLQDVYVHAGGVTQLVSAGDFAGSGMFNAYLRDVSEDGSKVFFTTAETIVADDTDRGYTDVFERSGGSTKLISTGPQTGGEHDAGFGEVSSDGSRVVFQTDEALTPADTDATFDVYQRAGGVTTLVSTGPVDGPGDHGASFRAAARHGGRVIFYTAEQLVPEDTDTTLDLYSRASATTTLESTGPADDGGGGFTLLETSEDASVLLFSTTERLVPGHTAGQTGYYRRAGGQTDLIVMYPASDLTNAPFVLSGDGSHVFFTTKTNHLPQDTDPNGADIYGWHDGTLELVSTGPGDTNTTYAQAPVSSFDGQRAFFQSREPLVPGDPDGLAMDLFERAGGTTFQVSPPGTNSVAESVTASSPDADKLLLASARALTPADTDPGRTDMYLFSRPAPFASMWAAAASPAPPAPQAGEVQATSAPPLPSTGNGKLALNINGRVAMVERDGSGLSYVTEAGWSGFGPAWSPDGSRLAFSRSTAMGTVDPDGTNRTWISEPGNAWTSYPAWSPDGQTIAFLWKPGADCWAIATTRVDGTESKIVVPPGSPCDKQGLVWSPDGETFLVSGNDSYGEPSQIWAIRPGETGATKLTNESGSASNPDWFPDGSRIAYQLAPAGGGAHGDVVRIDADGQNRTLLFAGSAPAWSPDRAELGYVRDSTNSVYDNAIDSAYLDAPGGRQIFQAGVSTDQIYELDWQPVPGGQQGYPRPKGASPVRFSLVPAYYQCADPNRTHGPALSFASCNPPVQTSDHLTVGTPDANGNPALFYGYLKLRTVNGNPSTPADEADVTIAASLPDIRCRTAIAPCASGTLSDYTGRLRARVVMRMTDKLNALGHAITTQDIPLTAAIPCAATPSSAAGSNCTTATSLDALVPGTVPEGKRSNWQLDQVTIYDGGADGDPATGVNTIFAVPGIFVP